jgi:hypothetical protein
MRAGRGVGAARGALGQGGPARHISSLFVTCRLRRRRRGELAWARKEPSTPTIHREKRMFRLNVVQKAVQLMRS